MIKVNIEYICDECGKSKKEKTIIIKGYEDVDYSLNNVESCYMPDGWSCDYNKTKLFCSECTKKNISEDSTYVA